MSENLSVVIPVSRMSGRLNDLKTAVKEALEFNYEVIIVHDRKDDKTGIELHDFIENYAPGRILYIESEFGTPGRAREAGYKIATSNYIAFWDSDDVPKVSSFPTLLKELVNSGLKVAIGNFEVFQATNQKIIEMASTCTTDREFLNSVGLNPGLWRFVFHRDALNQAKFADISWAEDQVLVASIISNQKELHIFKHVVYQYKTGLPGQLSTKFEYYNELPIAIGILNDILKITPYNSFPIQVMKARLFLRFLRHGLTQKSFPNSIAGLRMLTRSSRKIEFLKAIQYSIYARDEFRIN